ncbi:MAG: sulfite exporter TauE/SafE family protein [Aquabacterium sp.]
MSLEQVAWLSAGVFVIAVLYSSVGHAGASGYIAVMTLLGLAPEAIKPAALALNILVAAIAAWQFRRAGHFSWPLFWPFAVAAVPMAFLGGWWQLPAPLLKTLLGLVLLYSAARFFFHVSDERPAREPARMVSLAVGAAIGLLAGLTGTGGGIFLTPLILLMGWARAKTAAAVSALFILVNSVAGLAGNLASTQHLPAYLLALLLAAGIGGAIGSHMGSRHFPAPIVLRLLAAVLLVAGLKLLAT